MDKQKGQSLLEILVGLGIISILMGAATYALVAALKESTITDQTQTAGLVGNSLMDSAVTLAEGNWNNVYNLVKGSTNHYFIANSPTTTPYIVAGDESVLSDNITNGLVGHWKFDELSGTTAYDSSGNGNLGTLINAPTRMASASCKIGACLSFDGVSNKVQTSSLGVSGTSDFTISAWIKVGSQKTTYNVPVWNGIDSVTAGFGLGYRKPNSMSLYAGWGSSNGEVAGPIAVTGNWYYLVSTYDKNYHRFYVNGVLQNYVAFTTSNFTSGFFNIGSLAGSYFSNDIIDDVRIYNRALSASEISQLFNSSVYSRYFYVDNVNRTACGAGSITTSAATTCTGSANDIQEDPSTQKITVGTYWNVKGVSQSFENSEYVTRWINSYAQQNGWGGSAGVVGTVTDFGSNYYYATNTATTTTGSIKISGF